MSNNLTPAEAERLAYLAEECGEVIRAVGKVLVHGFESTHPDGGETNRNHLYDEILDVTAVCTMMRTSDDLPDESDTELTRQMFHRIQRKLKYSHHQDPDLYP